MRQARQVRLSSEESLVADAIANTARDFPSVKVSLRLRRKDLLGPAARVKNKKKRRRRDRKHGSRFPERQGTPVAHTFLTSMRLAYWARCVAIANTARDFPNVKVRPPHTPI